MGAGRIAASVGEAWGDFARGTRAFPASVRRVARDPRSAVEGAPVLPIVVLFGHTFLDSFDRNGFNLVLPEVQDHFDLDYEQVTALAAVAIVVGILLSLPVSLGSDRSGRRTLFLAAGAFIASVFSLTAGIATTVGLFGASRAGFGFGLIVNDPVQQSLLSDYTPVASRASVFAGRQIADNLGGILGPLTFGLLTWAFGFRAPLLAMAVLALLLGVVSIRLREPARGQMERAAMGASGADLDADEQPLGFRAASRELWAIGTVQLLWLSLPALFGGVLSLLIIVPLYLEEVFGLGPASRGILQAVQGVPAIFGLFLGAALTKRFLFSDRPQRMFRLMAGIAVAIALLVLLLALLPWFAAMVAVFVVLGIVIALVLPAYGTVFSIVFPARARTVGFAITRLWALPGLVMLPIVGAIGDAHGLRWGIIAALPIFLLGSAIVGSGGRTFQADMAAAHEASMAAIAAKKAAAD